MSPANGKDEQPARKPRARPTSTAFTAPENRLLSQLYLANKEQYHAKARVTVGAKSGLTSQERYATEFAAELTKLGFTRRTTTQVKQRIADIRKLAHKLVNKEVAKDKNNKKLVVEPWLQDVIVALGREGQENGEQKKDDGEIDKMSAIAENVLDDHLQAQEEPTIKRRRSTRNIASHEKVKSQSETNDVDHSKESLPEIQKQLALAQLRVALKTERLLELKIKKMEAEMTAHSRRSSFVFSTAEENPEEHAGKEWKTENTITAQIQEKNTADLIECLLTLKGVQH